MTFSPSPLLAGLLTQGRAALRRRNPAAVYRMGHTGTCEGEGVCLIERGQSFSAGVVEVPFTFMSAVKPFLLLRVLECHGAAAVAASVGDQSSDLPYYSLDQLRQDGGRPRNAMINSGAMLLSSKLPGSGPVEQMSGFVRWMESLTPGVEVGLDEDCLEEVLSPGGDPTNFSLALALESAGHVPDAGAAYEIYFRLCCLSATLTDMARLAHALALREDAHGERVLQTMELAGLYEASAEWKTQTGLPAKSGVSGVMLGVWPGQGAVAACSPWLEEGGNPIIPMQVLAELAGRKRRGELHL